MESIARGFVARNGAIPPPEFRPTSLGVPSLRRVRVTAGHVQSPVAFLIAQTCPVNNSRVGPGICCRTLHSSHFMSSIFIDLHFTRPIKREFHTNGDTVYRRSSSTSHIHNILWPTNGNRISHIHVVSHDNVLFSRTDLLECQTMFPAVFRASCAEFAPQHSSSKNGKLPEFTCFKLGSLRVHSCASDRPRRARHS